MTNSQDLSIIGYFTWWSINDVKIRREDLQKLVYECGLGVDLPGEHDRSAFLKAVREVKIAHGNKGILIRKVKKDEFEYVFGLVDEHINEKQETLTYSHKATMKFIPVNGQVETNNPHRGFDLVKELYESYRGYLTSDDVRALILRVISNSLSVSIRQKGGIYFIPEAQKETLTKLNMFCDLLAQHGGDIQLMIAPQIDAEASKNAIYKSFWRSLKDQIATFTKELEDGGLSQNAALERRLNEFKELRSKIDFYKDAMQFQVEDLAEAMDNLTEKAKQRMLS